MRINITKPEPKAVKPKTIKTIDWYVWTDYNGGATIQQIGRRYKLTKPEVNRSLEIVIKELKRAKTPQEMIARIREKFEDAKNLALENGSNEILIMSEL